MSAVALMRHEERRNAERRTMNFCAETSARGVHRSDFPMRHSGTFLHTGDFFARIAAIAQRKLDQMNDERLTMNDERP